MDNETTESMKLEQPKREDIKTSVPQGDINPAPDPIVRQLPEPPRAGQAPADGEAAGQASDGKKKKRAFVSAGERIHNEITYRGVDWIANSALAVAFAFITRRTKAGYDFWEKYAGGLSRFVLKPFFKNATRFHNAVDASKTFLSILFGGTVIIPPMMYLENHNNKKGIVKFFDRMIYGRDTVENDPKFEQAYKEIDLQPKKDFTAGMISRFMALTPMFLIMTNEKSGGWLEEHYYPKIADGTKWISKKVGIKPPKSWDVTIHTDPNAIINTENIFGKQVYRNNWDYVHHLIGYDFGMTIFYSILHEISYKGIARLLGRDKHKHETAAAERKPEHQAPILHTEMKKDTSAPAYKPGLKISHAEHLAPLSIASQLNVGATS